MCKPDPEPKPRFEKGPWYRYHIVSYKYSSFVTTMENLLFKKFSRWWTHLTTRQFLVKIVCVDSWYCFFEFFFKLL